VVLASRAVAAGDAGRTGAAPASALNPRHLAPFESPFDLLATAGSGGVPHDAAGASTGAAGASPDAAGESGGTAGTPSEAAGASSARVPAPPPSGLSIYWPLAGPLSPAYRKLAFAGQSHWADFLQAFLTA
jgi:hypothetical protein